MPTPLRVPFYPSISVCEVDGPLSVETPSAHDSYWSFQSQGHDGCHTTPQHSV